MEEFSRKNFNDETAIARLFVKYDNASWIVRHSKNVNNSLIESGDSGCFDQWSVWRTLLQTHEFRVGRKRLRLTQKIEIFKYTPNWKCEKKSRRTSKVHTFKHAVRFKNRRWINGMPKKITHTTTLRREEALKIELRRYFIFFFCCYRLRWRIKKN